MAQLPIAVRADMTELWTEVSGDGLGHAELMIQHPACIPDSPGLRWDGSPRQRLTGFTENESGRFPCLNAVFAAAATVNTLVVALRLKAWLLAVGTCPPSNTQACVHSL